MNPRSAMPDVSGQPHRGVRVAEVWDQLVASLAGCAEYMAKPTLDIVDVGGGSGVFAVPLAANGHRVTVVDPNPNALATLKQRAGEAGVTELVTAVQGDAAGLRDLVGADEADAVLCHGVLEVVDDPSAAVAGMVPCLRAGALVSVVVAQRTAAALGKALAGHFAEAHRLLDSPEGRWGSTDPLPRRFSEATVTALLTDAGLEVDAVFGVRVFTDLVPGALVDDPADVRELAALESRAAKLPEMRPLAAALHVIASYRSGGPSE